MARRSKSSQTDKEDVRRTAEGLKHPFPAKPGEGKYVLYCDTKKQGEDHPRVFIPVLAQAYAARRILDVLIGNAEFEDCEPMGSRSGIVTSSGVRVTAFGDIIEELLAYELSSTEAAWRNEHLEQSAMRLKLGGNWEGTPKQVTTTEEVEDEATGELVTREVKQKKGKKEPKEKAEKKPKLDKSGMVTAADLAARLKIEPRIFRGALRALNKVKPEGGWFWSKDEAEAVFKEISQKIDKNGKLKK